ncbi:MAG: hypothetical protein M1500_02105 [Candidatus Marsarchaeota archaeon]|nr:hypothetical protein [Candidatus Marsarchaeota archaeon]
MSYVDNMHRALDALLHPGKATKKSMGIVEALKFYYTIMIIPLILGIIISIVLNTSDIGIGVAAVVGILLTFIVFFPLGILVDAGIYHLIIGKLFKLYKGNYAKPVSAFTYAIMPSVLIYWLVGPLTASNGFLGRFSAVTPSIGAAYLFGAILSVIFGIWSIVVMIIALSNQLSISRLKALGTLLLEWFIVGVIAMVLTFIFAATFISTGLVGTGGLSPTLGNTCIGSIGYMCTNLSYSGSHLNFTFGQATGSSWTGVILYAVPYNTSFSTSDGNDAIGNLASGSVTAVSIPVLTSGGSTWVGSIWAVYNVGNTTKENVVATVSATAK